MVAQVAFTKKAQSQIVREQNIRAMVDRIVDRGSFWLVPSSHCSDMTITAQNVNDWHIVNLQDNYCDCESLYRKNATGENKCMHKEAARRRYEAEQQYYRNYEMGL